MSSFTTTSHSATNRALNLSDILKRIFDHLTYDLLSYRCAADLLSCMLVQKSWTFEAARALYSALDNQPDEDVVRPNVLSFLDMQTTPARKEMYADLVKEMYVSCHDFETIQDWEPNPLAVRLRTMLQCPFPKLQHVVIDLHMSLHEFDHPYYGAPTSASLISNLLQFIRAEQLIGIRLIDEEVTTDSFIRSIAQSCPSLQFMRSTCFLTNKQVFLLLKHIKGLRQLRLSPSVLSRPVRDRESVGYNPLIAAAEHDKLERLLGQPLDYPLAIGLEDSGLVFKHLTHAHFIPNWSENFALNSYPYALQKCLIKMPGLYHLEVGSISEVVLRTVSDFQNIRSLNIGPDDDTPHHVLATLKPLGGTEILEILSGELPDLERLKLRWFTLSDHQKHWVPQETYGLAPDVLPLGDRNVSWIAMRDFIYARPRLCEVVIADQMVYGWVPNVMIMEEESETECNCSSVRLTWHRHIDAWKVSKKFPCRACFIKSRWEGVVWPHGYLGEDPSASDAA